MDYDVEKAKEELGSERFKAALTLVITAAATIANMYGWQADVDTWVNVALSVLNGIMIIWTWWFNQNVTLAAVRGQHVLDKIKEEDKSKRKAA